MKFNTTIETSVTQKVVTVKHDCNDGTLRGQEYTFLVPDDYSLQKGDIVRLQTRRGEKLGVCTTNSVEVPLEVLNMLERVSIGEGKNFTGLVLGKYEYIPFEWEDDEDFDEDEDGEGFECPARNLTEEMKEALKKHLLD